jgi:hypothetical protein
VGFRHVVIQPAGRRQVFFERMSEEVPRGSICKSRQTSSQAIRRTSDMIHKFIVLPLRAYVGRSVTFCESEQSSLVDREDRIRATRWQSSPPRPGDGSPNSNRCCTKLCSPQSSSIRCQAACRLPSLRRRLNKPNPQRVALTSAC